MTCCYTPEKHRYDTKREAREAAHLLFREGKSLIVMRAYHCRCHFWHLTRNGPLEAEISRLLRVAQSMEAA